MSDPDDLGLPPPAKPSRAWWIVGSGLALVAISPVVWIGGTALGMYMSFLRIEESAAPTPDELREGVQWTRIAALVAAVCFLSGLVIAIVGVLRVQRHTASN